MTLKEKLAALAAEAATLRTKAADKPEDFTEADAERATKVASEHAEITAKLEQQAAATKALSGLADTPSEDEHELPGEPATTKGRTLGQRFVRSEAYRGLRQDNPKGITKGTPIHVEAKDLVRKVLNTGEGSTESRKPVHQFDDVEDLVYRPQRRFLDLVTTGTTNIPFWRYRQLVSKTNNAAVVPESTNTSSSRYLKPTSSLTLGWADAKEHTYADGIEVTTQELTDDGIIQTLIDTTLTENVDIVKEDMILNGEGSEGGNGDDDEGEPLGLFNVSGVLQQDFDTDIFVSVRKAITLLQNTSGANIQAVALNPEDMEEWELAKISDGRFLGNGPFGTGPSTAWGYERIPVPALPAGTAVMGDFSTIHLLTYQPLAIEAFNQHKDFAQRNLVYVRAEERAAQLFRAPAKLALVDLTGN